MKLDVMKKYVFLFIFGGLAYGLVECLYKGNSHISMFLAGGASFILVGLLDEGKWKLSLTTQMLLSGVIITSIEYITGLIVNVTMHLNVWNYSDIPYNFQGQICLPFSIIWSLLSIIAILLDDYMRYWMFHEDKPKYIL